MQPSKTMVVYPMVSALLKAEDMLGPDRVWKPINETQAHFLTEFFQMCREEAMSLSEIESIASRNIEDINTFLRQRGFTIQLRPLGPDSFGVASVLDLLVSWQEPGAKVRVECIVDHRTYDAVWLGDGIRYSLNSPHPHPIVTIKTQSGDVVHMSKLDHAPEGFELVHLAEQLTPLPNQTRTASSVTFPMVDLNQEVDVSWMGGMQTRDEGDRPFLIAQALQQTILKMNEQGARAKSASAMGIILGSAAIHSYPIIVIDAPFLLWFTRPNLKKPLFVGYITMADWKNPGSLS